MTGIIVGRFQTPYLHEGHLFLINSALNMSDQLVIVLGTRPFHHQDERNPYTSNERIDMIGNAFPNQRMTLIVLYDRPTDEQWSNELDDICSMYDDPVLFHSRDSFREHYTGKHRCIEVPEIPNISATQIRNKLNNNNEEA